jgi:hypothetical protein
LTTGRPPAPRVSHARAPRSATSAARPSRALERWPLTDSMSSRHGHRINRWRAWALPVVPAAANRASPRSQDPQDGCGRWWPPPPAKPTLRPPSPSCTRPNGVAFPAKNCSRWPSTTGPNPGCTPEPGGPSNAGWSAAPAGYGPTGHAARPSAWSSSCVGRDRAAGAAPSAAPTPHHAKHQHQHDHDDQHPQPCRHGGLLGRRRASSR